MDDQAYLEPGFDATTLTVPRLRSILVAHNVNYPSSAKKQQLVDLFNETVVPQASKLRSASLRVKRTSRGIEDVGQGRGALVGDDDDEDVTPAPRSGRRTTRARTEEAQEVAPTPRSFRHSTAPPEHESRRSSGRYSSGAEPEARRPTARRSRVSTATPIAKTEEEDEDSPFSMDNVFQAGSSPYEERDDDTDRRRSRTSGIKDVDRRRSHEVRRRTDETRPSKYQVDGAIMPTRRTFEIPVKAIKREEIEASEEFTPEAEQELVQAEQAGELVPARRQAKKGTGLAARGAWTVALAMLAGFAVVWRQEKIEVGYCGYGRPSTEIAGVAIPEWADVVRPKCEPCPQHADCDFQFTAECYKGFALTQHPLSFGGVIPLPPTCEPDSTKSRKVKAVKERVVEELREKNADYECGKATSPEVKETVLKDDISKKRRKGMTDEEFEDLWASAIGEISRTDEIVSGSDGTGHPVLRSNSLARIPISCAIRRSLRATLGHYFWQLVGVMLVLCASAYGRYRIISGRNAEEKAKQLAALALEKLSLQASWHAQDPQVYGESYISMAQLRDDVLRNEFSATRRRKLWDKVQKKVEANTNVRPMVREGRTGDVGRVWEWIGSVGMLESPPTSSGGRGHEKRRSTGRVSFADEDRMVEPKDRSSDRSALSNMSKWEESKPYY